VFRSVVSLNLKLFAVQTTAGALELTHLAEYFKQEKLSDADLVIYADEDPDRCIDEEQEPPAKRKRLVAGAGDVDRVLARFPVHRLALVATDYFKAQVGLLVCPAAARLHAVVLPWCAGMLSLLLLLLLLWVVHIAVLTILRCI
jgi:hypothetical protein